MIEELEALVAVESPSDDADATAAAARHVDDLLAEHLGSRGTWIADGPRGHLLWSGGGPLQVLLLAVSVFAFFVVFGSVVMTQGVQEVWIGSQPHALPWATNLSVELLQVAVFLSAFSAFYISVTAVTDEAYRGAFFTGVMRELERSIAVRAAYNAVRRSRGRPG